MRTPALGCVNSSAVGDQQRDTYAFAQVRDDTDYTAAP